MMRALFCVVPEKGHVNPCIGPAQRLRARGIDVAFYAHDDMGDQLERAGPFAFLGPRVQAPRNGLHRGAEFAANVRNGAWLRRWIRALLIDHVPAQVESMRTAMRSWRPDVVVIDPLLYAAAIAAELESRPWVALSNSLNPVLPDALDSELLATVRDLASTRAALFGEYGMTASFRGCDILSPALTIAFTTEAFVGKPPAGVTLVGPSLAENTRGDETPFPWQRLDGTLPLVYMSLGSQIYYQPDLFAKVIRALHDLPVQLVLSVSELLDSVELPKLDGHAIAVRYAPQMALLRRASLFISHGGANSVMEALACAVPMILSPLCNDQFHQAYFVERAGVGRHIDLGQASPDTIAEAVRALLGPGPVRRRVEQVAVSYRRDGAEEAARLISELAAGTRPATAS
jgi:zeaxanthin glucosyltransferase